MTLEPGLQTLGRLPKSLFDTVVTHPLGEVKARAEAVAALLAALDSGRLPTHFTRWPGRGTQQRIAQLLERTGAVQECESAPQIAEAFVADLLTCLEHVELDWPAQLAGDGDISRVRDRLTRQGLFDLESRWKRRVRVLRELGDVEQEFGLAPGKGIDLNAGQLRSRGWADLQRLRRWLETVPQLRELIEALGRHAPTRGALTDRVQRMSPYPAASRPRKFPHVPMETRGLRRSDEIARMLPQEAAFLGHPTLKYLWFGRRAEHGLLTYAVAGVMPEALGEETPRPQAERGEGDGESAQAGPILLCLDTSASMEGVVEKVSKAVVLETLRVANAQRRSCTIFLFGGEGEVIEFDARRTTLRELLEFISQAYRGGTDVRRPLQRAIEKNREKAWQNADILLVSDGEFQITDDLVAELRAQRDETGLNVVGLQLGYANALHAMRTLCDPVHIFRDWADLADMPRADEVDDAGARGDA